MLFDFETVSVVRLKGVRHGAISIGATATPGIAKIGFRSAWGCNSKAHTPPDAEARPSATMTQALKLGAKR
jgi:hypothetical protein